MPQQDPAVAQVDSTVPPVTTTPVDATVTMTPMPKVTTEPTVTTVMDATVVPGPDAVKLPEVSTMETPAATAPVVTPTV